MNQYEIIEMARQAGMDYMQYISEENMKKVEAFAKLVAVKEREACAKVCDEFGEEWNCCSATNEISTLIRARGES